jgi:hypothetical protein
MISDPWAKQRLQKQLMTMRIVWIALMVTVPFYGFLLSRTTSSVPIDWSETIKNPLFIIPTVVSMGVLIMSIVLPNILMTAMNRKAQSHPWTEQGLRSAVTAKGQRLYREQDIPKLLALKGQDLQMVRAAAPYMMGKVVQWAMAESAATMGFVLTSQIKSIELFYPFALAALLGLLIAAPGLEEMRRRADVKL